jgi:outer membrane lipoprotein-sorting protein
MKELLSIGLVSLWLCAATAYAQEGPKQAFDATYTSTNQMGTSTMRMISDGKGHMRTETTTSGMKSVTITDWPNHCQLTILDPQKMVMKMQLKSSGQSDIHDAESAKKSNATSLGTTTIAGHPCHGWKSTNAVGTTELWIGDDINYMVRSETILKTGGQKVTTELKNWSKATPSADQFKAPANYKVTEMPGS